MASLLLAYAVISLLLLGVAIYEYTNAATLSLPLSPASTISTIILPILSFFNTAYYTTRSRTTQVSPARTSHQQLLPRALQVLQTIVNTVLGTTFFSDIIPSATRQCLLSTRWQQLWATYDATAIRRIQDTFDCCGLNSVKDRSWPFPNKANPQPDCASQLGRTMSCAEPWTRALQTTGGIEFGIVATVCVLQHQVSLIAGAGYPASRFDQEGNTDYRAKDSELLIVNIIVVRHLSSRGRRSAQGVGWMTSAVKRLTGEDAENSERNRPLLEDAGGLIGNGHHGRTNLSHGSCDEARPTERYGTNGYGGTYSGPPGARVEPPHLEPSHLEPSHLEPSPWGGEEDSDG